MKLECSFAPNNPLRVDSLECIAALDMDGGPTIRYGVLLAALAAANGIDHRGGAAFENRLKHLKRNGFPPGAKLGKTGRYDYTASDIVGIAAAIRLIDAYVMPTTAIQMVLAASRSLALLALDVLLPRVDGGDDVDPSSGSTPLRELEGAYAAAPPPSAYLLFRGSALSELGERAAGAGRYDAPVGDAILLGSGGLGGGAMAGVGSGVVLNGWVAFEELCRQLEERGLSRPELATGLLASLSPADAAAAEGDAAGAPTDVGPGFWHFSMLLRALQGTVPGDPPGESERIVMHHARLLLMEDGVAGRVVGGIDAARTIREEVLELLTLFGIAPRDGTASAGGGVEAGAESVAAAEPRRRALLDALPKLASVAAGRS